MKKDTVYIDNDDEITSITDKVQSASSNIVALVLPKRCTVLQSTVNMKILNRAATSAGKKVVLITSEAALLPVAGSAGMFVAKTLQSKPAVPKTPNYDENAIDEVTEGENDETPIDPSKSIVELAGSTAVAALAVSSDDDETIELGDEEAETATDGKKDKKKADKKDKKLKVPNFDTFRAKLFAVIGGIVLFRDSLGIIAPAVGVAIGAVLQLIVAALGMLGLRFNYTWGIDTKNNDYQKVMKALPARSIDQGVDYINSIFVAEKRNSFVCGVL